MNIQYSKTEAEIPLLTSVLSMQCYILFIQYSMMYFPAALLSELLHSKTLPYIFSSSPAHVAANSAVYFRASVLNTLSIWHVPPAYSAQVPSKKISVSLPSSRIPTICKSSDPTIKSIWIIESLIPFA